MEEIENLEKGIKMPYLVWKDIVIHSRIAYLKGYRLKDMNLNRKNKSLNLYFTKTGEISKDTEECFMGEYFEKSELPY